MIPIYGFLQGDTLGLLILAEEQLTMRQLGIRLQRMARTRVTPSEGFRVVYHEQVVPLDSTVNDVGICAFDRIDVRDDNGVL